LRNFVKVNQTWSIFGQTSKLVPRPFNLIKFGWSVRF